jgi:HK97 family phage portal protein
VERRDANIIPARSASAVSADGVHDPVRAMRHGAVWACVNYIADLVACLPVDVYRSGPDGSSVDVASSLAFNPGGPNGVDRLTWNRQALVSGLVFGNLFIDPISFDSNVRPTGWQVLDPCAMKAKPREGASWPYDWFHNGEPMPNVKHFGFYTMPGQTIGMSPLEHAARAIGLGLSAEEFGLRWFVDGAHPSALLSTSDELGDGDIPKVKERFMAAVGGTREPLVMGGAWKYEPMSVPANESQFLETTQANVADVARYFGLKAEDIGGSSGDSMTYANIEQRGLDRLTYPINQWIIRLETVLNAITPRPQFVKLNPDALVRVDLKSRYEAHDIAIRSGMATVNERRALEDLPPLPSGDEHLWPPYSTAPQGAMP